MLFYLFLYMLGSTEIRCQSNAAVVAALEM